MGNIAKKAEPAVVSPGLKWGEMGETKIYH